MNIPEVATVVSIVVICYLIGMSVKASSLLIFCLFIVQSGRRNGKGIAALFLSLFRRGRSPCPQQTADLDHTGLFICLNSVWDQRYQKCP